MRWLVNMARIGGDKMHVILNNIRKNLVGRWYLENLEFVWKTGWILTK
jgi:hypothetical protein